MLLGMSHQEPLFLCALLLLSFLCLESRASEINSFDEGRASGEALLLATQLLASTGKSLACGKREKQTFLLIDAMVKTPLSKDLDIGCLQPSKSRQPKV